MNVEKFGKLVVAVSSRALFDFTECNTIFENQGVEAYERFQLSREHVPLKKGMAFSLVKKLLSINTLVNDQVIEVVLVSRNNAQTGLRVLNSIEYYGLPIIRAIFTDGKSPHGYVNSFGSHLFLSVNPTDAKSSIQAGCGAATLVQADTEQVLNRFESKKELRIAFDGDAVIFSDESERINRAYGLEAVRMNERINAYKPLKQGPFYRFLKALNDIKQAHQDIDIPIRTALVTARSMPSHKRVIHTLRSWSISVDESYFLGGLPKGQILDAFGADIFFDDTLYNCMHTARFVATGHVPNGVVNEVFRSV